MPDSDRPCRKERDLTRLCVFVVVLTCVVVFAWLREAAIEHGLIPVRAPNRELPRRASRFELAIPPNTPMETLLPEAPDLSPPLSPWLVQDLTRVPEIAFQKPSVIKDEELAVPQTATVIARINHLNQKGDDHFLKMLLENRTDLIGLPFFMGDACRQSKERAQAFLKEVSVVRISQQRKWQEWRPDDKATWSRKFFWTVYEKTRVGLEESHQETVPEDEEKTVARIAALMQIMAPEEESEMSQGLVECLARINHTAATRLARLAVFSFEEEIRQAALLALRDRPAEDSTDILLAALRYPWPAVARNAGAAIVSLGRQDLFPRLIALLDEPDPRAPQEREVNGQKMLAVREVVRLNHLHNCLLCHAPGNTPDVELDAGGRSTKIMTGTVPSPGQPLPFEAYASDSPDILVRADVTYLRQDFSLLHPVRDAAPWPDLQRFDYLVRTRPVTSAEAEAYQDWVGQQGPGYLSPHTQAILGSLRVLTGRDVSEPTANAWKLALGINCPHVENQALGSDRLLLGLGGLVLFVALGCRRLPLILHGKTH